MGLGDGGDFWPGERSAGFAEMPSSSLATRGAVDPPPVATSILSSNIVEQSLMGDWSLLVSVAQHMNFDGFMIPSSSGVSVQADKGTSAALDTNLPGFNNGGISQIMTSTSLPANGQGTGPICSADLGHSVERGDLNSNLKKKRKTEEDSAFGTQYPLSRILVAEAGQKKEMVSKPAEIENPIKEELKEKDEQNPSTNTQKLASEQTKEDSSKGDIVKQDYVHLRAKRGHATNSHSLAERVRRQKISERMKFLQDLVPGCSKITGKAMMLDEIINYVQSLQHQVEFLSMKLADVNPEVNLEAEKILSEGVVFYSQTGVSDALGFSPGFASSLPPSQR